MNRLLLLLTLLPLIARSVDELHVYAPVPGLAASEHYTMRVRAIGGEWKSAFAWQTECKTAEDRSDTLAGWTHTYVKNQRVRRGTHLPPVSIQSLPSSFASGMTSMKLAKQPTEPAARGRGVRVR
jgi:hypothetical protein